MSLIENLATRLKRHPKRVVFPEGADPRIIQAARQFATQRLGVPVLLGDRSVIKENASQLNISLDGIRIIEPQRSEELEIFTQKFQGLRRFKGMAEREAHDYVIDTNYFATLMLATSGADALVAGATLSASSALRPLFQIIPLQDDVKSVSSMLIMETSDTRYGIDGTLFLTDCAVIPEPDEEQLASNAMTTAGLVHHLTDQQARVAMLSYTTKSKSSKNRTVTKVQAATALAHEKFKRNNVQGIVDGDLQVDTALDPYTARQKNVESSVAGKANVLVFPDLASANIGSKLVQILGGARVYGQVLTGLRRPAAEISRSASAHDIYGTAVVVAAQAVDKNYLYALRPDEVK